MNTAALKQNLLRNLSNLPGWRTRRHIVVIESDDWGSIRMASHESFRRLRELLAGILRRWPDAEFMTSDELGDLIAGK